MNDFDSGPARGVDIPLGNDEALEIKFDDLPDGADLVGILTDEKARVNLWYTLAIQYYKQNRHEEFEGLLKKVSNSDTQKNYLGTARERVDVLNALGAHYTRKALSMPTRERRSRGLQDATLQFEKANAIIVQDPSTLLNRALRDLYAGEIEKAATCVEQAATKLPNSLPVVMVKGCVDFNKGKFEDALESFKTVLRRCRTCPASVRLGIGLCYYRLGNHHKARIAFERTLELDPDNVQSLVALAVLEMNSKTPDSVKKGMLLLRKAYEVNPRSPDPQVLNYLATHFFFKRDFANVHALAMNALEKADSALIKAESCFCLGRAHHCEGDHESAFQRYQQAVSLDPTHMRAQYTLGQMHIKRGENAKAIQCFEKVQAKYPDNYETLKILSALYPLSAKQENKERAITFLRTIVTKHPDDVEALIELGRLLKSINPKEALTSFEAASDFFVTKLGQPSPPEVLNNIGCLKHILGDRTGAREAYTKSLANGMDVQQNDLVRYYQSISVSTKYNMARLLEDENQTAEAEAMYTAILEEHPSYFDCIMRLGKIQEKLDNVVQAAESYTGAINASPQQTNVDGMALLAGLHVAKQEWRLAEGKLHTILNSVEGKNDAYASIMLANIFAKMASGPKKDRQEKKALDIYAKVLRRDMKNLSAANGIGMILAQRGRVREARDIFLHVREGGSAEVPDASYNLAQVNMAEGRHNSAIRIIENMLVKSDNRNRPLKASLLLGKAYYMEGDYKACKSVLQKALHVVPYDKTTGVHFNLALVMKEEANTIFEDITSPLATVEDALNNIKAAKNIFAALAQSKRFKEKFGPTIAQKHDSQCKDVIAQGEGYRKTAMKMEQRKATLENQVALEQRRAQELQTQKQEARRLAQEEQKSRMETERSVFVESTKDALRIEAAKLEDKRRRKQQKKKGDDDDEEKGDDAERADKSKKRRKSGRGEDDFIVDDDSDEGEGKDGGRSSRASSEEDGAGAGGGRRKKPRAKRARNHDNGRTSSGDEGGATSTRRKKKFKSKEFADEADLSSDEDGDGETDVRAGRHGGDANVDMNSPTGDDDAGDNEPVVERSKKKVILSSDDDEDDE